MVLPFSIWLFRLIKVKKNFGLLMPCLKGEGLRPLSLLQSLCLAYLLGLVHLLCLHHSMCLFQGLDTMGSL